MLKRNKKAVVFGNRDARWKKGCAVVIGVTVLACAELWSTAPQARGADELLEYAIEAGDKIKVIVAGQPDLSGEILIDRTGFVSLPMIGRVEVAGLTPDEMQKRIATLLADGFLKNPSVTVRVSELRPLFVLGGVRTPGSYPFTVNATVKTAVALAGGYGIGGAMQEASAAEVLNGDERVRQLQQQQVALSIRRARLEAQRDKQPTFIPAMNEQGLDEGVRQSIAIEKQIFESLVQARRRDRELFERQQALLDEQIASIDEQIDAERKHTELVKQQLGRSEALLQKGIVRQQVAYEMKISESSRKGEMLKLMAERLRMRMAFGEREARFLEAEAAHARKVMEDLSDVDSRLRDLAISLPTAVAVREVRLHQASLGTNSSRTYTITRTRNGRVSQIAATELTALEPGDVVEITAAPLGNGVGAQSAGYQFQRRAPANVAVPISAGVAPQAAAGHAPTSAFSPGKRFGQ